MCEIDNGEKRKIMNFISKLYAFDDIDRCFLEYVIKAKAIHGEGVPSYILVFTGRICSCVSMDKIYISIF
jgi:hypothetical protein